MKSIEYERISFAFSYQNLLLIEHYVKTTNVSLVHAHCNEIRILIGFIHRIFWIIIHSLQIKKEIFSFSVFQ